MITRPHLRHSIRHFASVTKCDALVIGGGIGGTSTSYRLAKLQDLNVICLEASTGYHASGKSYGIFAESNARCVQSKLLTAASRSFFESPDAVCVDNYIRDNFEQGILKKVGLLAISSPDDYPYLYQQFGPTENIKFSQTIKVYPQKDVTNMVPFLNTQQLAPYAIYEPNAAHLNTGLVYQHFLVGGNACGVRYHFNQRAVEISKNRNGNWDVLSFNAETDSIDRFSAGILVNCTGEWGDEIAEKAGITPLGLVSENRNIIVFTYAEEKESEIGSPFNLFKQRSEEFEETTTTPWVGWISPNIGEVFHSHFEGGNGVFLYSDQIQTGEADKNEQIDEKIAGDHAGQEQNEQMVTVLSKIAKYTTLKVKTVASKAVGIRCSSKYDKNIVIGPSVEDTSFVWCGALGDYSVQTAPAYSEIVSYLAVNKALPNKFVDLGIDVDKLLPARLYQRDPRNIQNIIAFSS